VRKERKEQKEKYHDWISLEFIQEKAKGSQSRREKSNNET